MAAQRPRMHRTASPRCARLAAGDARPLGRGLSIWRAALDASTISRFNGVSRFVPCSFGAPFHRGDFSTAEREALKPPTPFMRARPCRRLALRRCAPPGERRRLFWCAAPERLRVGQASLRRQGERAGRGRATFSARIESGQGGEAVATWGFESCRLSAQLPWHKRGTIIMACGSIGRPAQHRVQPTRAARSQFWRSGIAK
jgi:hypothetical protein